MSDWKEKAHKCPEPEPEPQANPSVLQSHKPTVEESLITLLRALIRMEVPSAE